MTPRTKVRKIDMGDFQELPGWFISKENSVINGKAQMGVDTLMFRCICKKFTATLLNHSVDANGEVNASILCGAKGCNYHIWGILEEWEVGRTKKAGSPI